MRGAPLNSTYMRYREELLERKVDPGDIGGAMEQARLRLQRLRRETLAATGSQIETPLFQEAAAAALAEAQEAAAASGGGGSNVDSVRSARRSSMFVGAGEAGGSGAARAAKQSNMEPEVWLQRGTVGTEDEARLGTANTTVAIVEDSVVPLKVVGGDALQGRDPVEFVALPRCSVPTGVIVPG